MSGGDPSCSTFDLYTPAWLDTSCGLRVLVADTYHLQNLLEEADCHCGHCPWCNGNICADAETAERCWGGCDTE